MRPIGAHCRWSCRSRIIRAFLIEEEKIVVKVLKAQQQQQQQQPPVTKAAK